MSERNALKHGQAKVQYYACREKINQLQEAGYSIQAIYDLLIKDGVITMSYKALHRNISIDRASAGKEPKFKNLQPADNARQAKPKSSTIAPPGKNGQPSNNQNLEWSLDDKLAALDKDGTRAIRRKRSASTDSDYNESEVL